MNASQRPLPLSIVPWFLGLVAAGAAIGFTGCDANFTISGGYSFTKTGETAEQEDSGEIDSQVTNVRIRNQFGTVTIDQAPEGQSPSWTWKGKVWSPTQEQADEFAQQLVVEVKTEGDTQTWTLLMPEAVPELKGVESNLQLRIGSNVAVDLVNKHGDSLISNISNDVEAASSFGDVVVNSVEGNVTVNSKHSDVAVKEVSGKADLETSFGKLMASNVVGDAELNNSHGDIEAMVAGKVIAKTSFGNAMIEADSAEVKVTNSHGDVTLTVKNPEFSDVNVKTKFGKITLKLPEGVSPKVEMDTSFGDEDSEFGNDKSSQQHVKLDNSHGDIQIIKWKPQE